MLFVPFLAKADFMGFSDGNVYNSQGQWSCLRFMDGNCYSLEGKLIASFPPATPITAPTLIPAPTQPDIITTYCILPVKEWRAEIDSAEKTYLAKVAALDHVAFSFIGNSNKLQTEFNSFKAPLWENILTRSTECNQKYNYYW